AALEGDVVLDGRLITGFVRSQFAIVLTPQETDYFSLRIAHERRVRLGRLQKELGFAGREDFNPLLVGGLNIKLVAFAKERKHEIGNVNQRVLADEFVKLRGINLDFLRRRILRDYRKRTILGDCGQTANQSDIYHQ